MREKATQSSGTFIVEVNGREASRLRFGSGGLELSGPVVLSDAAPLQPGTNTVTLKRTARW